LNVSEAPAPSDLLDHVNLQVFDVVAAELPLPLRGLSVAPEGTASLVQWTPLGTLNWTLNPDTLDDPPFLMVIVPQKFGPS
jgi:hypothetical protein